MITKGKYLKIWKYIYIQINIYENLRNIFKHKEYTEILKNNKRTPPLSQARKWEQHKDLATSTKRYHLVGTCLLGPKPRSNK